MVLNVGLVSACIIYKNRPGAMTRLEKLAKKLKEKPITQKILYSYPVKIMFSIFAILCFIAGLIFFLQDYKLQIQEKYPLMQQSQEPHLLFSHRPEKIDTQTFNHSSSDSNAISMHYQYQKVSNTVYSIILFFIIPLLLLIKSLKFQKIIVKKRLYGQTSQVSGHIENHQFSLIAGWKKTNQIQCLTTDSFFIQLEGQDRFTNTCFHYAIKRLTKKINSKLATSNENDETQPLKNQSIQMTIVNKGNIFEARQFMIYLGHILNFQPSNHIKNGPIKKIPKHKRKVDTKG